MESNRITVDVLWFLYYNNQRSLSDESTHEQWINDYNKLCEKYTEDKVHEELERLSDGNYFDYGVSLRSGWILPKGRDLLAELNKGFILDENKLINHLEKEIEDYNDHSLVQSVLQDLIVEIQHGHFDRKEDE